MSGAIAHAVQKSDTWAARACLVRVAFRQIPSNFLHCTLTFAGDGKDLSVIGKFPWQTLRTAALRDAQGECLWYVVSGRFKNDAWKTDPLNWDTQGQIDVVNEAGSPLANDVAALLVAPGPALDGQQRRLAETAYAACGGNYDARNYLDPFMAANALAGQVNYFAGSTNNRVAPNSGNKAFVVAMTIGSIAGTIVGGLLLGAVPTLVLIPLLVVLLLLSAVKVWRHT